MAKFNFKKPLLGLDDEPMKNAPKLNEILAVSLMNATNNEPRKLFEWALDLKKDGIISLDTTDKTTLETWINNCQTLNNLFKGRLLEVLDNPEKKEKDKS